MIGNREQGIGNRNQVLGIRDQVLGAKDRRPTCRIISYLLFPISYLLSVASAPAAPSPLDAALDAIRKAHNPSYLRYRHADIVADILSHTDEAGLNLPDDIAVVSRQGADMK